MTIYVYNDNNVMIVVLLPLLGSRWCESKDDDEFLCVCRDGYQGMFTCNVYFVICISVFYVNDT